MPTPLVKNAFFVLLAVHTFGLTSGLNCGAGRLRADDEVLQAVDELYQALDEDQDGAISFETLARAMGQKIEVAKFDARIMAMYAMFDPNFDKKVERSEFDKGQKALMDMQLDRSFGTDANGDNQLSRKEHALGIPDANGEKQENGFTARQNERFDAADTDGDGRITKAEIEGNLLDQLVETYQAMRLNHGLLRCDTNDDGDLELAEFAKLYEWDEDPASSAKAAFESYEPTEGKLTNRQAYTKHINANREQRYDIESRIKLLSLDRRIASATAGYYKLADKNSDGQLTEEENAAIRGQREADIPVFERLTNYDMDKDGLVGQEELRRGFRGLVYNFVNQTFPLDVNQDGNLSLKEYALSVPNASAADGSGYRENVTEGFKNFDRNADVLLSRQEYMLTIYPTIETGMCSLLAMASVFRSDANKDGLIQLAELQQAVEQSEDFTQEQIEALYAKWTTSEDSKGIQRAELLAALKEDTDSLRKLTHVFMPQ